MLVGITVRKLANRLIPTVINVEKNNNPINTNLTAIAKHKIVKRTNEYCFLRGSILTFSVRNNETCIWISFQPGVKRCADMVYL
jgi:hypothetical protein